MRRRNSGTRLTTNSAVAWLIETVGVPAFLFIYWVLLWQVERLDYLLAPPGWLEPYLLQLGNWPQLQQVAANVLELFSWRVLRHFLPVAVAFWLAYRAVVGFVWDFYGLPKLSDGGTFLGGLRQSDSGGPKVNLKREEFAELREKHPLLRVGGPGTLIIGESDVVVTERNGRFHRVLGPGARRLGRLEYVRAVLDLRQQERTQRQVPMITRDGIEVRVDVSVTFRLRLLDEDGHEAPRPTPETPYPFGEDAVRRAAYAELVLDDGTVTSWEDRPMGTTISTLRRIVGENPADMLIYPELTVEGAQTFEPHRNLRETARQQAGTALRAMGIELLEVKLGRLETTQEVTKQRIERWRANWERQVLLGYADGEAEAVHEVSLVRAEAEAIMLRAIVEGLEDADDGMRGDKTQHEVLALRLIGALEQMTPGTDDAGADAEQVIKRIRRIQDEIRQAPGMSRLLGSEKRNDS